MTSSRSNHPFEYLNFRSVAARYEYFDSMPFSNGYSCECLVSGLTIKSLKMSVDSKSAATDDEITHAPISLISSLEFKA